MNRDQLRKGFHRVGLVGAVGSVPLFTGKHTESWHPIMNFYGLTEAWSSGPWWLGPAYTAAVIAWCAAIYGVVHLVGWVVAGFVVEPVTKQRKDGAP